MSSKRQNLPVWVSQNYLTSKRTIDILINKATIKQGDFVVEIGPGKGHITNMLLKRCGYLAAIEVDKRLYDGLSAKFEGKSSLKLYNMDFLKWDLPKKGDYKIFSNIPFCHTTAILCKLAECKNPPLNAWLIMEKGAAKRFMGTPRENASSLCIKTVFDISIVHHFRREDFHPAPRVDVVMIHLKRKQPCDITPNQRSRYQHFVSCCFNANYNREVGLRRLFTKKQLLKVCKDAGVCDLAVGEIKYIQWLCLFRSYISLN